MGLQFFRRALYGAPTIALVWLVTLAVAPPPAGAATRDSVRMGAPAATSAGQVGSPFSPSCTDNWVSAVSGDFNTPADWSTGAVPGSSDVACITVSGTYTVSVTQSNNVAGLVLGSTSGAETLDLAGRAASFNLGGPSTIATNGILVMDSPDGNYSLVSGPGPLTNDGTFNTVTGRGSQRYIRTNVVNAAGATTTIGAADTRMDSGTTFTNMGTFSVAADGGISISGSSTFTQTAGSFSVAAAGSFSGNSATFAAAGGTIAGTVVLQSSTLADANGRGKFILQCGDTLSGTIPAGQTVTVQGNGCGPAQTILASPGVTNKGTLKLDSTDGNYALIQGAPLINKRTFTTVKDAGGTRYIRVNVTNGVSGTVIIGDPDTRIDSGTTLTNTGTLSVSRGGGLALSGSSAFVQAGGVLTVTATGSWFNNSSTVTLSGGTVAGTVVLQSSTLADSGGETGGTFILQCTNTLSGIINAGQTVNVQGNGCGPATTTLASPGVTNNGTLKLDSTDGNYALINGAPLTNNKTFTTVQDAAGTRYIRANVTNGAGGTISIGAADTRIDSGNTLTNTRTLSVAAGGGLALSGSSALVQAGGMLAVAGAGSLFNNSSTVTLSGGSISGTVVLQSSTLADTGGTGGTFILQCGNTLSGTINAGQTVSVQGNGCGPATTTLASPGVTNNGTLEMDSTDGNYALIQGAPLTNNASFATLQDAGGTRYIRANVTNGASGTMSIAAADTRQDSGTTTTNTSSGTVSVADGANLALSGGSSFSQGASGTLNVAIDATNGAFGLSGGTVSVGGTLGVVTTGNPPIGNMYAVISGVSLSGTFATVSTGSTHYSVAYSSSAVTLTRTA